MSVDVLARPKKLTRAHRRVLTNLKWLCDDQGRVVASSRQLAKLANVQRNTVLAALNRLNELQPVRTLTGNVVRTSEHIVVLGVRLLPLPGARKSSDKSATGRCA